MQIMTRYNNPYPQSFRANPETHKEYTNPIPKRVAISAGIFASMGVLHQLATKYSPIMQRWSSQSLVDEITKKGFSKTHLMQDVALGALVGLVLGYFENKRKAKEN